MFSCRLLNILSSIFLIVDGEILTNSINVFCPHYRNGPKLNVYDLVGSWITVYIRPKAVNCYMLSIRAVTESERDKYYLKYGNFSSRVDWSNCFLEVETPIGKHYLQGDGSGSGVLENIIIFQTDNAKYILHEQSADQWTIYGRRGSELAVMRDCAGKAIAVFARIPYWPTPHQLYATLHHSGVNALTLDRVLCEPNRIF